MATADQIETQVTALTTAATTLAGYGSTLGTTGYVTATSTKKHSLKVFAQAAKMFDAIKQATDNGGQIAPVPIADGGGDSITWAADDGTHVYVVARIKK